MVRRIGASIGATTGVNATTDGTIGIATMHRMLRLYLRTSGNIPENAIRT
jgi:hypothetical protein